MSIGSLNLFPRPRFKHESSADRDERRKDAREARMAREAEELRDQRAAVAERERQVSRRERAQDREDATRASAASGDDSAELHDVPSSRPGATAPGRSVKATAELILSANAMRLGLADIPLSAEVGPRTVSSVSEPELTAKQRDESVRLITQAAQQLGQAPKASTGASGLSPAAKMILNADAKRRGGDIEEAV